MLKARCEPELLELSDVVQSQQMFNKTVVKVKTQLMFTQKKFNLLREESEGYSKLIAELCQGKSGITPESAPIIFQRIQALIGYFDLDPNRCFDLVLDAFEQNLSAPGYMSLIELFNPSQESVCQLIGFKFAKSAESDKSTPKSLYRLAAMMVKKGVLRLNDVYVHLTPTDPDARENEEARRVWMEKKAKAIGVVSLAEGGSKKKDTNPEPPELPNQKLGLLEGLLDQGDLENAERLFTRIAFMRPASHGKVAKGLCSHLTELFDPLYEQTPIAAMLRRAKPNAKAVKAEAQRLEKEKEKEEGDDAMATDEEASPWDTIENRAMPLMRYLGCHIGQDVKLFTKICRTVLHLFSTEKKSGEVDERILKILMEMVRVSLMPGLTLITSNPAVSADVWAILNELDYTARFEIYGDMKTVGLVKTPELVLEKARTNDRAKKVTQRISNETFKQQGRELGKLSHSNPIVVFERIIATVKMMPNIISALVDSLRYISPLAFDVLTYLLVEGLSDPERSRLKADGQNLAEWLAALADMCGSVCRRYQYMELSALLKYVSMQMISGNTHDLIVLRKIIGTMGGVEAIEDLTEAQLTGQSGGMALRNDTNTTAAAYAKANTRTTNRLKKALVESSLAAPLVILTGQQVSSAPFDREFRQIKLIGEVYDKCHETLEQLVIFLATYMKKDDEKEGAAAYAALMPSLKDLVVKHKIEPAAAFFILRSVITQKCGGVKGIVGAVKEILPADTWTLISPELYATFWSLSLYDIAPPEKMYGECIAKHKSAKDKIERDRSLRESQISKKLKEENAVISALTGEKKVQLARRDMVQGRLKKEAPSWMVRQSETGPQGEGLNMFVQSCIFPRVLFSQLDAVYCAKFVLRMHEIKTPHFSVLLYFDKVFKQVAPALHCASGNEARRLGRFLGETLKQLTHWAKENAVYRRECLNFPGFKKSFTDPKAPPIPYIDFVRVLHKWHVLLYKMFVAAIGKSDTEIRNSLIIMEGCVNHFPAMKKQYATLEKRCVALEKDERQDLKMMALAYRAKLKKREEQMVTDEKFRKEPPKKSPPKPKPKPKKDAPPPPIKTEKPESKRKRDSDKPDGPPKATKSEPRRSPASSPTATSSTSKDGHDRKRLRPSTDAGEGKANGEAKGGGRHAKRDRDRDRERDREGGAAAEAQGAAPRGGRGRVASSGKPEAKERERDDADGGKRQRREEPSRGARKGGVRSSPC